MVAPLFSILHPSARPHKWREIYDAWIKAAAHPENVEYVLCADERWGFTDDADLHFARVHFKLVWNTMRRCYVDSVNLAAKASTGRILIVIADDQYPCEEWDERLLANLPDEMCLDKGVDWSVEFVLQVSTGTPNEHERGMIVMPILSRARYERLGYVFYPEYESMYADNDFYEHAKQDGCIIDARNLMFPHRHPWNEAVARGANAEERNAALLSDEAYAAQNRLESYRIGERVLKERRRVQFSNRKPLVTPIELSNSMRSPNGAAEDPSPWAADPGKFELKPNPRGSIALALPGETFSAMWVVKILDITAHLLQKGWNYLTAINYTSIAGVTRQTIVSQIELAPPAFKPDYILWIDDDQIVDTAIVDLLIADMEALPDADIVAGWTWIAGSGAYFNAPQVSCGRLNFEKGEISHADYRTVQPADGVFEVHWTGFPVLLMRPDALKKVGKHPFAMLPAPDSPWGMWGEDISFCKRLRDAGGKIYVDSRAFVPHLKLKPLGPSPESKDEIALALSGRAVSNPPDITDEGSNFLGHGDSTDNWRNGDSHHAQKERYPGDNALFVYDRGAD